MGHLSGYWNLVFEALFRPFDLLTQQLITAAAWAFIWDTPSTLLDVESVMLFSTNPLRKCGTAYIGLGAACDRERDSARLEIPAISIHICVTLDLDVTSLVSSKL